MAQSPCHCSWFRDFDAYDSLRIDNFQNINELIVKMSEYRTFG